jgi:hypothetical protein
MVYSVVQVSRANKGQGREAKFAVAGPDPARPSLIKYYSKALSRAEAEKRAHELNRTSRRVGLEKLREEETHYARLAALPKAQREAVLGAEARYRFEHGIPLSKEEEARLARYIALEVDAETARAAAADEERRHREAIMAIAHEATRPITPSEGSRAMHESKREKAAAKREAVAAAAAAKAERGEPGSAAMHATLPPRAPMSIREEIEAGPRLRKGKTSFAALEARSAARPAAGPAGLEKVRVVPVTTQMEFEGAPQRAARYPEGARILAEARAAYAAAVAHNAAVDEQRRLAAYEAESAPPPPPPPPPLSEFEAVLENLDIEPTGTGRRRRYRGIPGHRGGHQACAICEGVRALRGTPWAI